LRENTTRPFTGWLGETDKEKGLPCGNPFSRGGYSFVIRFSLKSKTSIISNAPMQRP
jgi:hypothetical protein